MSAPPIQLGRIEWLDIRGVWEHEATGFTPWLLTNVDELAEALGLEVELEAAEHAVGGFSLDLIGRDLTHDALLIVENQIEASDHTHLGQLLTYAAGTDAATIVWVARSFREEHRNALDWLNEHTGEDVRFFGVVVKALRVGDSQPAPFFELVAKPNDWQKAVRQVTAGRESAEHAAYRAFWKPLRDAIAARDPRLLEGRAEPRSMWLTVTSPIPGTYLSAEAGSGELRIKLEIDTGDREGNLELLSQLQAQRERLESTLGPLDFDGGKHRCKVLKRRAWQGRVLDAPDRQDDAREWFFDELLRMRGALAEALPPSVAAGA